MIPPEDSRPLTAYDFLFASIPGFESTLSHRVEAGRVIALVQNRLRLLYDQLHMTMWGEKSEGPWATFCFSLQDLAFDAKLTIHDMICLFWEGYFRGRWINIDHPEFPIGGTGGSAAFVSKVMSSILARHYVPFRGKDFKYDEYDAFLKSQAEYYNAHYELNPQYTWIHSLRARTYRDFGDTVTMAEKLMQLHQQVWRNGLPCKSCGCVTPLLHSKKHICSDCSKREFAKRVRTLNDPEVDS
jgi:hypothetical protein